MGSSSSGKEACAYWIHALYVNGIADELLPGSTVNPVTSGKGIRTWAADCGYCESGTADNSFWEPGCGIRAGQPSGQFSIHEPRVYWGEVAKSQLDKAIRLCCGGGGGSRTRVRRYRRSASTSLVSRFDFGLASPATGITYP